MANLIFVANTSLDGFTEDKGGTPLSQWYSLPPLSNKAGKSHLTLREAERTTSTFGVNSRVCESRRCSKTTDAPADWRRYYMKRDLCSNDVSRSSGQINNGHARRAFIASEAIPVPRTKASLSWVNPATPEIRTKFNLAFARVRPTINIEQMYFTNWMAWPSPPPAARPAHRW